MGQRKHRKAESLHLLSILSIATSQKRCKIRIITMAKFVVIHRRSNESSMKNITNAYLQLERYAVTDLVVYERSKCGNMKEINTLDFKCLGFF